MSLCSYTSPYRKGQTFGHTSKILVFQCPPLPASPRAPSASPHGGCHDVQRALRTPSVCGPSWPRHESLEAIYSGGVRAWYNIMITEGTAGGVSPSRFQHRACMILLCLAYSKQNACLKARHYHSLLFYYFSDYTGGTLSTDIVLVFAVDECR